MLLPPGDGELAAFDRITGIDAHARPLRHPGRRPLEEVFCSIGVGQDHAQIAVIGILPVREHGIGGFRERAIVRGKGGIDHRQLVRVGADGLHFAAHGNEAVRRAEKGLAQAFHDRLDAPVLPEKAVPPARAEIGNAEIGERAQALHVLPKARHGTGIEHLQLELAEPPRHRATMKLHDDGERRDLPHGGLDPRALERQLVLIAAPFEVVGGKAEVLEPLDEIGREHLPRAIEHVAAQPGRFSAAQRE